MWPRARNPNTYSTLTWIVACIFARCAQIELRPCIHAFRPATESHEQSPGRKNRKPTHYWKNLRKHPVQQECNRRNLAHLSVPAMTGEFGVLRCQDSRHSQAYSTKPPSILVNLNLWNLSLRRNLVEATTLGREWKLYVSCCDLMKK